MYTVNEIPLNVQISAKSFNNLSPIKKKAKKLMNRSGYFKLKNFIKQRIEVISNIFFTSILGIYHEIKNGIIRYSVYSGIPSEFMSMYMDNFYTSEIQL